MCVCIGRPNSQQLCSEIKARICSRFKVVNRDRPNLPTRPTLSDLSVFVWEHSLNPGSSCGTRQHQTAPGISEACRRLPTALQPKLWISGWEALSLWAAIWAWSHSCSSYVIYIYLHNAKLYIIHIYIYYVILYYLDAFLGSPTLCLF